MKSTAITLTDGVTTLAIDTDISVAEVAVAIFTTAKLAHSTNGASKKIGRPFGSTTTFKKIRKRRRSI